MLIDISSLNIKISTEISGAFGLKYKMYLRWRVKDESSTSIDVSTKNGVRMYVCVSVCVSLTYKYIRFVGHMPLKVNRHCTPCCCQRYSSRHHNQICL